VINEAISATFNDRSTPGVSPTQATRWPAPPPWPQSRRWNADGIIENARRVGEEVLRPALAAMANTHRVIGDVRGLGVFFALDLVSDRKTREPCALRREFARHERDPRGCRDERLLIFANFNRLHVVPPCTVTDDEARDGLNRLDRALRVADRHYVGA